MYRIDELQNKEVIDVQRAVRLGYVADVEFSEDNGSICALIVPGRGHGWFSHGEDLHIPWHSIDKIGEDLIIVRLPAEKAAANAQTDESMPAEHSLAVSRPLTTPRRKKGFFGDF